MSIKHTYQEDNIPAINKFLSEHNLIFERDVEDKTRHIIFLSEKDKNYNLTYKCYASCCERVKFRYAKKEKNTSVYGARLLEITDRGKEIDLSFNYGNILAYYPLVLKFDGASDTGFFMAVESNGCYSSELEIILEEVV